MNPNIFREYDIRGIVGQDLTDETVAVLAQGNRHVFSIETAQSESPSAMTRGKARRDFETCWSKVSMKPAATRF